MIACLLLTQAPKLLGLTDRFMCTWNSVGSHTGHVLDLLILWSSGEWQTRLRDSFSPAYFSPFSHDFLSLMGSLHRAVMHVLSWLYSAWHLKMFMLMQNAALGIQSSKVYFSLRLQFSSQNSYFFQNVGEKCHPWMYSIVFFSIQFSHKWMDGWIEQTSNCPNCL